MAHSHGQSKQAAETRRLTCFCRPTPGCPSINRDSALASTVGDPSDQLIGESAFLPSSTTGRRKPAQPASGPVLHTQRAELVSLLPQPRDADAYTRSLVPPLAACLPSPPSLHCRLLPCTGDLLPAACPPSSSIGAPLPSCRRCCCFYLSWPPPPPGQASPHACMQPGSLQAPPGYHIAKSPSVRLRLVVVDDALPPPSLPLPSVVTQSYVHTLPPLALALPLAHIA